MPQGYNRLLVNFPPCSPQNKQTKQTMKTKTKCAQKCTSTKTKTSCKAKATSCSHNVHTDNVDGYACRWIKLDNRKTYFVSDLVDLHGTSFIKYLPSGYTQRRVNHDGNSQMRRLVSASDFNKALAKANQ